jgi:hypothetical protein
MKIRTATRVDLEFQPVVWRTLLPARENLQQVSFDQVRFGQNALDIKAIQFLVIQFDPSPQVFQALKSAITKHIAAMLLDTCASELCRLSARDWYWRKKPTYSSDKTGDICSGLYVNGGLSPLVESAVHGGVGVSIAVHRVN